MESNHQKEIKIVCTIGPASETEETIKALADAGMSIARCNFSHGTHEEHGRKFALVREVNKKYKKDIISFEVFKQWPSGWNLWQRINEQAYMHYRKRILPHLVKIKHTIEKLLRKR